MFKSFCENPQALLQLRAYNDHQKIYDKFKIYAYQGNT